MFADPWVGPSLSIRFRILLRPESTTTSRRIYMALSPRSASSSTVVAAAASPTPAYLGFDASGYPGDDVMTAFWHGNGTPFYFTGFYLAPAPAHGDTGWMSKRSFLAGLGYGFIILYVGRQTTNLTYSQGQADGDNAASLANQAGFTKAVIYLDVEAGAGSITPALLSYIDGWLDKIDSYSAWLPGVYCSYKTNADQIKNSRPNMSIHFYVWNLNSPPSPGCSTNVGSLKPSDSGVSYAACWQYAQNCHNQTYNGKTINPIDLDLSKSKNPSAA
jgi:hypothetical protein